MTALIGDRATVDAYLRTRDGRGLARDIARALFADEERLAAYEAALDGDRLPPAVEYELSKLITARNAQERT